MSRAPRGRAAAWLVALSLVACSPGGRSRGAAPPNEEAPAAGKAGPGAAVEPEPDAATPDEPGDELQALDARVDAAWTELRALDDARETAAAAEPSAAAARCDRIRGLADEICRLSDRVCTLAAEHPGQARHADACARSEETCGHARQAAARCPAA